MKRYAVINKDNIVQSTFEQTDDWVLEYNDNDGEILIVDATNSEKIESGYIYKPKNKKNKFLPPNINTEQLWNEVRFERDSLLKASDWTQVNDCPLSKEEIKEWAKYRKALRDITKKYKKPEKVKWPVAPGSKGDE